MKSLHFTRLSEEQIKRFKAIKEKQYKELKMSGLLDVIMDKLEIKKGKK